MKKLNKLDRYRKLIDIIKALDKNDSNGTWDDILNDVDNCYSEAIKVLYEALKVSYEEANTYDDREYYKAYLIRVKDIL